jgi:hypothetical protein
MASYESARDTAQRRANETGDYYYIYSALNGQWMFCSEAHGRTLDGKRYRRIEQINPMTTKHKTDSFKVLRGFKHYPQTFTYGERTFTLVKGTWDDDELVGAIYTDQNNHEWLVHNDTGIEMIDLSISRAIASASTVLGTRGAELLAAVKELQGLEVRENWICHSGLCSAEECSRCGPILRLQKVIASIEKELA